MFEDNVSFHFFIFLSLFFEFTNVYYRYFLKVASSLIQKIQPFHLEFLITQGPIFWMLMWIAIPLILFLIAMPIFFLHKYSKKRKSKQLVVRSLKNPKLLLS